MTTSGTEPRQHTAEVTEGVRIVADGLSRRTNDGRTILDHVSLRIEPGELVAIVGGSGAGKTTLLEALATVRPADEGRLSFDGEDAYDDLARSRRMLGYVPQDDIIHAELPLVRTLLYAAHLRLPRTTTADEVERVVEAAIADLGLAERRDVRVGALSGGQRKRASIAVELLTRPRVFFLDEPTSGLDPATSAELLRVLRGLTHEGATVVFTTHAVQDLATCDRVVFLAEGGHLAFSGPLADVLAYFDVGATEHVYGRLATEASPQAWSQRFRTQEAGTADAPLGEGPAPRGTVAPPLAPRPGGLRQWAVLTRRTAETIARNRLTLGILVGSPAMIVAMFAVLFRPGAFDTASPDPTTILMIIFWVVFGVFFFGLTYGLLQVVTERPIVRREHLVGLRLPAYLLAKSTVLLPFLVLVVVLMLAVLRGLDRLPPASAATYASLGMTLTLVAVCALGLGLATSAGVTNASQATLALPMLCFPAVLFSGAILPVHVMARAGEMMSFAMPTRWGFEAFGRDLGVRDLLLTGGSPLGPPLVASYGDAGSLATGTYWAIIAGSATALYVAAWLMLRRAVSTATR